MLLLLRLLLSRAVPATDLPKNAARLVEYTWAMETLGLGREGRKKRAWTAAILANVAKGLGYRNAEVKIALAVVVWERTG